MSISALFLAAAVAFAAHSAATAAHPAATAAHPTAATAARPTPRNIDVIHKAARTGEHRAADGLRLSVHASDLYAARVRRRLASYLRMRLLELRKAGLERAAGVVERKFPIETLFDRR